MRYELDYEKIENDFIRGKTFHHNAGQRINLLPFRPDYNDDYYKFDAIIGEISRITIGGAPKDIITLSEVMEKIKAQVKTDQAEVLIKFIQTLYFNEDGNIESFHPKVFAYTPLIAGVQVQQKNIAKYIYDVLISQVQTDQFSKLYDSQGDIMVGLLMQSLPPLDQYKVKDEKYVVHEKEVISVFKEDLELLMRDEKLFIKWFKSLIIYYYFFYTAQTILKLNQRTHTTEEIIPLYFLVGDEKGGRERMSSKQGFKLLKWANENTFSNVMLCQFLNYNKHETECFTLNEWYKYYVQEATEEQVQEVIQNIEKFIEFYKEKIGDIGWERLEVNYGSMDRPVDQVIHKAYEHIKFQFTYGGRKSAATKYENWFSKFVIKYYAKNGGNLGYLLNIKEDLLLFIIGLTIKGQEKERLNIVFEELQLRGLWFDDYSKEYIVDLLEKRNLLEKKSDSGDAKYVRAIL